MLITEKLCPYCSSIDYFWDGDFHNYFCNNCARSFDADELTEDEVEELAPISDLVREVVKCCCDLWRTSNTKRTAYILEIKPTDESIFYSILNTKTGWCWTRKYYLDKSYMKHLYKTGKEDQWVHQELRSFEYLVKQALDSYELLG